MVRRVSPPGREMLPWVRATALSSTGVPRALPGRLPGHTPGIEVDLLTDEDCIGRIQIVGDGETAEIQIILEGDGEHSSIGRNR